MDGAVFCFLNLITLNQAPLAIMGYWITVCQITPMGPQMPLMLKIVLDTNISGFLMTMWSWGDHPVKEFLQLAFIPASE